MIDRAVVQANNFPANMYKVSGCSTAWHKNKNIHLNNNQAANVKSDMFMARARKFGRDAGMQLAVFASFPSVSIKFFAHLLFEIIICDRNAINKWKSGEDKELVFSLKLNACSLFGLLVETGKTGIGTFGHKRGPQEDKHRVLRNGNRADDRRNKLEIRFSESYNKQVSKQRRQVKKVY